MFREPTLFRSLLGDLSALLRRQFLGAGLSALKPPSRPSVTAAGFLSDLGGSILGISPVAF